MREILFRAKDIDWIEDTKKSTIYDPKRWYKGYYIKGLADYITETPREVSFTSLGEFTMQGFNRIGVRKMKVLELFAGTRSIGKAFEKRGWRVATMTTVAEYHTVVVYEREVKENEIN